MVDFHRLNPNALLVLLGTVIYVVVGGPWVVAGGVAIALGLGALHRPRGTDESAGMGRRRCSATPVTAVSAAARGAWPVSCGRFRSWRSLVGRGVWRMSERWCNITGLSGRGSAW